MAVKVIGRSNKYIKTIVCRGCSSELEYSENDEQMHHYTDYGGVGGTRYWIMCPACGKEVVTKDL